MSAAGLQSVDAGVAVRSGQSAGPLAVLVQSHCVAGTSAPATVSGRCTFSAYLQGDENDRRNRRT